MKKQLVTSIDVAGVPRGFDGCMSTEELKQHTKDILDWSLV